MPCRVLIQLLLEYVQLPSQICFHLSLLPLPALATEPCGSLNTPCPSPPSSRSWPLPGPLFRTLFPGLVPYLFSSVQFSRSVVSDSLNRSTPGLPVYHQLPEFTQTHVHRVSDAIQPSHPLLSPFSSCPQSLPASESFPMSQLFT